MNLKRFALRKMKLLTTSPLFLSGGFLYLSFVLDYYWLRAVSETALVGDCRLVCCSCTFQTFFGFSIPYIAIIPKSQDEIAKIWDCLLKVNFLAKRIYEKSTFLEKLSFKKLLRVLSMTKVILFLWIFLCRL